MSTFLYSHPIDNVAPFAAVTVQSGFAATGYGPEFLTDLSDASLGRPALAVGSSISFQLDFGAPIPIGGIVLWSNADAGLDVRFQGNASASWGTPSLDAGLTIPGVREDGYFTRPYKDLHDEAGYASYRYYLLKFPANSVPIGAKLLCFYGFREFAIGPAWGYKQPEIHGGILMETDGGSQWAYDLQLAARGLAASCDGASEADQAKLLAWWRAASGPVKPFVVIPEPSVNDAWIVRFGTQTSPGRVNSAGIVLPSLERTRDSAIAKVPIILNEVTAGGPEWI